MIVCRFRQPLAIALGFTLLLVTLPLDSGGAALYQAGALSGSDYSGQGVPLPPEELQSLVAPVALYPDALLAPVLIAATFPDQILVAKIWLGQNMDLPAATFIQDVSAQPWDPSVKALTLFPSVMNIMAQNLLWTSQLGESYHNQHSTLMAVVQLLRAKARTAENLKSTPQLTMAQPSGDIITLQPGNPLVVYVPQYNPALVYGTAVETPNYSSTNLPARASIAFGQGVAIGALSGTDWGWGNWGCNWYQGVANYRSYPYFGNHAWSGGYYGGYTYYGNHPYHDDATRPFSAQARAQAGEQAPQSAPAKHTFSVSGTVNPHPAFPIFSAWSSEAGGWPTPDDPRGWGPPDTQERLTAFSSWGTEAGRSFGIGGWGERAVSYRAWGERGGSSGWGIGGRSTGLHW
ncbi:MAG: DUF3300 domain-containing protein [Candidatus Korobacteraceae bacterium]